MNVVLTICFHIYVLGTLKNHLIEMVLLSTHNMFSLRNKNLIFNYSLLSMCLLIPRQLTYAMHSIHNLH